MDEANMQPYMTAVVTVLSITACAMLLTTGTRRNPPRWWTRPWILKRNERGALRLVNEEFEEYDDVEGIINFLRMDRVTFDKLLCFVKDVIEKEATLMRDSISAKNRLIMTLMFLSSGESYRSLHYTFRIGVTTISRTVPEVCEAIRKNLYHTYIKTPETAADWLEISEMFYKKWNFPNTLGAMDGKHIAFRAPREAGSTYFNYHQENSIVLFAVVDANYKFIYVDCGTNGRVSDRGVLQKSSLARAIENNSLNFPEWRPLPGRNVNVPFVLVSDAAFPLKTNILKPFPLRNMSWEQRIFNYRLSRARRVVENSFGILANRWRILLHKMNMSPEKAQLITETCCILHNFLLSEKPVPDETRIDGGSDLFMDWHNNRATNCGEKTSTLEMSLWGL